jgi:hypothetical protein
MTNCYLIEFLNLDGAYQYESFLAEDQYEAVNMFSGAYPKCEPYNVFMQVNGWSENK